MTAVISDIGRRIGSVYSPGIGDDTTDDHAAIQSELDSNGYAFLSPGRSYFISEALSIPANGALITNGADLRTSGVTAITLGNMASLYGSMATSILTSGESGAAIKKTDQDTSQPCFVFGWPRIVTTNTGVSGSVGLDFTAAYNGVFQVSSDGYETLILGGLGDASGEPATYYNLIYPKLSGTGGTYGIRLREGANGTKIVNPQINGADSLKYFGHFHNVSGLTIDGGYCERANDHDDTRGFFFAGFTLATVSGTTLEITTSANSNFAIGGDDTAEVGFYNIACAGAWGSSNKVLDWQSSGPYSWEGGAPSNRVLHVGQTTFPSSEINGTVRAVVAYLDRLGIADAITAPSAIAGRAQIYVDTADGDLKVVFGDGTVKTIATDT